MKMDELFYEARRYGKVHLYTHDDNTYSCSIKFNTVEHVELKAESGYKHTKCESAIAAALKKAIEITESLNKMEKPTPSFKAKLLELTSGKSITT